MKKYLIVFFLFSIGFANAEVVNKLVVEGNKKISKETIAVYGDIELNRDYTRSDTNEILKKLYSTDFFEDVSIQLNNKTLTIIVKEYSTINKITFEGEKANKIKKAILERLVLQEKNSYIESSLNRDINVIKAIYGTLGFNFVEVEAKIEKLSEDRINLVFFVDKGEKTKISKINFVGDKKIKDRRLRDIIVSQEYKFWKFLTKSIYFNQRLIELDKRLLKNYYKSAGYYDVQITSSFAEIQKEDVILTYNITDRRSFTSLDNWLNDINKFNCCKHYYNHPVLLLGTYRDKESRRQVSYKEGYDYARHNNLIFREVVSFNKEGPLDDGLLEFLRLIYTLTDKNRENIECKIPIAIPIKKKVKRDCKIAIAEESCDDLIICKGIKYNQKPIQLGNNRQFDADDIDEPNKFCGKCM